MLLRPIHDIAVMVEGYHYVQVKIGEPDAWAYGRIPTLNQRGLTTELPNPLSQRFITQVPRETVSFRSMKARKH